MYFIKEPWGLLSDIQNACTCLCVRFEHAAPFSFQTKNIHNRNAKRYIQSLFPGFKPLYAIGPHLRKL